VNKHFAYFLLFLTLLACIDTVSAFIAPQDEIIIAFQDNFTRADGVIGGTWTCPNVGGK